MYKYYLTQRGIGPGCQPSGFVSFEDTDGELTTGKRCYGYVVYNAPLSEEQIRDYELIPHTESVYLREVKPFKGWRESGIQCYEDYVNPGDIVDWETIAYFRDVVPPHRLMPNYLQYGEAWDIAIGDDGVNHETWTTFYQDMGRWYYAGHCFTGEIKHRG